jgi:membrane protein DedA with SNARE-associated domain
MELLAYLGLFAAVLVTWVAVSGPGEAALVSAAALAPDSYDRIVPVLAIAFLGTLAGSFAAYWLGRLGGRRLILTPGPLLGARARALARTETIARRRGFLASLLGPGWFAGINEISLRPFLAGCVLSGLGWTLAIGLGTVYVGPSLIALFDQVGRWATLGALAGATGVAAFFLLRRRAARGPAREPARQPAS